MLIVVAIIAITSALAAPAIHQSIMERKGSEASLDLVRLGRRARSSAIAYGRAHLVRFDPGGTGEPGRFRVYRGVSSGCNSISNDWATIIDSGPECGEADSFCVDWLDLEDTEWTLGSSRIRARENGALALVDICYEPRGTVLHRTAALARFSNINNVNGGYVFSFDRLDGGGSVTGVSRRVVMSLGGDARPLL
jgi:type II secretory pathway pseudopilin PulG